MAPCLRECVWWSEFSWRSSLSARSEHFPTAGILLQYATRRNAHGQILIVGVGWEVLTRSVSFEDVLFGSREATVAYSLGRKPRGVKARQSRSRRVGHTNRGPSTAPPVALSALPIYKADGTKHVTR